MYLLYNCTYCIYMYMYTTQLHVLTTHSQLYRRTSKQASSVLYNRKCSYQHKIRNNIRTNENTHVSCNHHVQYVYCATPTYQLHVLSWADNLPGHTHVDLIVCHCTQPCAGSDSPSPCRSVWGREARDGGMEGGIVRSRDRERERKRDVKLLARVIATSKYRCPVIHVHALHVHELHVHHTTCTTCTPYYMYKHNMYKHDMYKHYMYMNYMYMNYMYMNYMYMNYMFVHAKCRRVVWQPHQLMAAGRCTQGDARREMHAGRCTQGDAHRETHAGRCTHAISATT